MMGKRAHVVVVKVRCENRIGCTWFEECHKKEKSVLISRGGLVIECSECQFQPGADVPIAKQEPLVHGETTKPMHTRKRLVGRVTVNRMKTLVDKYGGLPFNRLELERTLGISMNLANQFAFQSRHRGFFETAERGIYKITDKGRSICV